MEYFSRLLGSRTPRSSDAAAAAAVASSSSSPSSPAPSSARSGFLRAVAGIGDSDSNSAASSAAARRRGNSNNGVRISGPGSSPGNSARARARAGRKGAAGNDDLASGFIADWEAVRSTLTNPDQRALHYGIARSDVPLLLERMADALILESSSFTPSSATQGTTDIPACMEYLLRSSLLDILVQLSLPNKPKGSLAEAIRFFTHLIVALDESFVSRQAVHRPLARLIRGCVGDEDGDDLERLRGLGLDIADEDDDFDNDDDDDDDVDDDDDGDADARRRRKRQTRSRYGRINSVEAATFEQDLVDLMAHIAARIKGAPELLLIFFHDRRKASHQSVPPSPSVPSPLPSTSGASSSPYLTFLGPDAKPEFPLFSYLLRFIHREGNIGELARAGLLNLVTVALAPEAVAIPFHADSSSKRERSFSSSSNSAASARQALAAFILDSDFAEVLGAGLGAVYGLLPTKLVLLRPQPAPNAGGEEDEAGDGKSKADASGTNGGGVVSGASMLGSEGMRLGVSTSAGLPAIDSDLVDAHFLLDDAAAASAASELPERLRAAGMATSNDPEVQSQVRLLVLLLDFAQDVLSTAAEAIYRDSIIAADAPAEQAQHTIASGLTLSIVQSVRSIFLQNVVYPSMLECSDADGSATAVMAYLDVLLSVIDDRSVLADVVVGYLVGAEGEHVSNGSSRRDSEGGEEEEADAGDNVIRLEGNGGSSFPRGSNRAGKKLKRRRSTALRLVQEDSRAASNNRWGGVVDGDGELAFAYNASDDAFGRYTLKDLILAHIEESSGSRRKKRKVSAQARQAAFRLLRTVLAEHGRFAMISLIGCVKDEGATAFPFPKPAELAPLGSGSGSSKNGPTAALGAANGAAAAAAADEPQFWPDEAPAALRKLDDDLTSRWGAGEDDSQPWSDGLSAPTSNGNGALNSAATSSSEAVAAGAALIPGGIRFATVPIETHLQELALYSYIVGSLRAIDDPKTSGVAGVGRSLSGIQPSSYERYLQDASDLLAVESTYLYGLEVGRHEALPLAPFPHRLAPRSDPVLRTLVQALARFFTHSPESNVLLTGAMAALARCPYRNLEGWLCPRLQRREVGGGQGEDEGDAGLEEQIRAVGSYLSWSPAWIMSSAAGTRTAGSNGGGRLPALASDAECPIVLHILLGLAAQVRRYARSIPEFSTYLRERREGLMFVENLNDALGLGGIGVEDEDGHLGFGDGDDATSEPSTPTASVSHGSTGGSRGGGSSKSAGTAVVPPSKVPGALLTVLRQEGEGDESGGNAGLPAVLYYKTAPPEDAGRPGTTTLPSSAAAAAASASASSRSKSARAKNGKRGGRSAGGTESPLHANGVMVQPFARHYAETGAIFVGTAAVRLPRDWRTSSDAESSEEEGGGGGGGGGRRRIRFEDDGEGEGEGEGESESEAETETETESGSFDVDSPPRARPSATLRASNVGFATAAGLGSTSGSVPGTPTLGTGGTGTKGVLKKKRSDTAHVTLSALLDNVVILEQAVMELLAVVQVRRCAGIDAVALSAGS
ncbi:hypothetical protein OC844_002192 [Tilletia horrida]|nr:hypothetical protein OC844_002192 [Tilletia horrida]